MTEPVAALLDDEETAVVYEDGAVVVIGTGGGDPHCSEHGTLVRGSDAARQCDHEPAQDDAGRLTVPVHEAATLFER